ncbi:DoxX family protein [Hymenobacter sp. B81]|uniref:DoxX family protein n=1 Tax=Hymenobacter sp. B81 TaxID=3344878 RepID=UPI0037DD6166
MKPQTTAILYWSLTLLFAAVMLLSGLSNLLQTPESEELMRQLGYPVHVLRVIGLGKTLGALALLQHRFRTLKEWAYAGFTFDLLGASAAWAATTADPLATLAPLLFLVPMFGSYALWKRRLRPQLLPPVTAAPSLPAAALAA